MTNPESKNCEISIDENHQAFLIEKINEIIIPLHKGLKEAGIVIEKVPTDYNLKIAQKAYKKIPEEVIEGRALSCKEKGEIVVNLLKEEMKEKINYEISLANANYGEADAEELTLIENMTTLIDNLKIYPLHTEIKNKAWIDAHM